MLNAFVQADIDVLVPFGGGCPFDLAIVWPATDAVIRLQVKSGRLRNGCVEFNTHSTDHGRGPLDYHGRADMFAVQVPELTDIYVVPVIDCGRLIGILRLEEPRNNQRKGVRYAADYTLQTWLNTLWEGAPAGQLPD